METASPDPSNERHLSRRELLRLGLIGAGVIMSTALVHTAIEHFLPPDSSGRSSEFSKTPDWRQNFANMSRTTLDTAIWRYELSPDVPGYNDEAQAYTDRQENVRIEQGTGLVIEAHKRNYQYPNDKQNRQFEYTSGRVDTLNSLSFEYGKVEAKIKLPQGEGVWPAFWLLSGNEVHTSGKDFTAAEEQNERFYMRNGEVDIMENYGKNEAEATVHTFNGSHSSNVPIADGTDAFHTYGVEITPSTIIWTLDDTPYHQFNKISDDPNDWPFGGNNHLYIIFNLAMGGPAGPVNDAEEPWRMEIADVAFYGYTGDRP